MNVSDYIALDGVGLAQLIENGEISRQEAAQAAIHVIECRNPELNAVIMCNIDSADLPPVMGEASALRGVPFLLKDVNLYSADMPTTFGSAYFMGEQAKPDSVMVDRWRRGGLTILGKTNTPEFAGEFVTEPSAYGNTINPAAPDLTVGGSGGGCRRDGAHRPRHRPWRIHQNPCRLLRCLRLQAHRRPQSDRTLFQRDRWRPELRSRHHQNRAR